MATQGFNATGLTLTPTLNFAPTRGTQLTLINNTATPASANPISGMLHQSSAGRDLRHQLSWDSLQFPGQLSGGDGNDLVLTMLLPEVTNVMVGSTGWSSAFLSYLASQNSQNVGGYSIPVGSGDQLRPCPGPTSTRSR